MTATKNFASNQVINFLETANSFQTIFMNCSVEVLDSEAQDLDWKFSEAQDFSKEFELLLEIVAECRKAMIEKRGSLAVASVVLRYFAELGYKFELNENDDDDSNVKRVFALLSNIVVTSLMYGCYGSEYITHENFEPFSRDITKGIKHMHFV